jgi:hypothetical protein
VFGANNRQEAPAMVAEVSQSRTGRIPGMDEHTIREVVINPFFAVTCAETLCIPHPPLVTKEQWIQANRALMNQMGVEPWLRQLLEVLETGGATGA